MKSKRIVILSEDFPPQTGGIAQWAAGVAQSLHDRGHEVLVVTRFWDKFADVPPLTCGYKVDHIRKSHWKRLRTLYWRAAAKKIFALQYQPDLVIATTWNAARGIMSITKKHGVHVAIPIYGLEITRKMGFFKKWWCRATLRKADHLIAISRFTRDRLAAFCGITPDAILTVPCGVTIGNFNPGPPDARLRERFGLTNSKVILTLSRVVERKGHDMVISALPAVLRKVPNAKYLIAGDPSGGFTATLKALVEQLNLQRHVVFAGLLKPDEIIPCYNLCDVYIMPSRELHGCGDTEGFGITFLEANACEKPVVGGNSGGVADAIENGVSGFLIDPLSTEEIAEKLILLLTDESLAKKMGMAGRERILRGFTWDAITDKIIDAVFSE